MRAESRSLLRARFLAALLGMFLALASLFSYDIGISASRGISPGKIALLALGAALTLVGILGSKTVKTYVSACVLLINILVLIALVEGAWLVLQRLRDFLPRAEPPPSRIVNQYVDRGREDLPYFQQQDWATTYWREYYQVWDGEYQRYKPYVVWRSEVFSGRTLNIDEDGRRLTPGADCGQDSLTVFALGGSTMWGTGVPDWGTIPAFIQAELSQRLSRPVCVLNLSEQAYVSTQELIQLILELRSGNVPDLVVFYDGINDVFSSYQSGLPGLPQNLSRIEARFEVRPETSPVLALASKLSSFRALRRSLANRRRGAEQTLSTHRPLEIEPLADSIARTYLGNYETVSALSEKYGFSEIFFWQPLLLLDPKSLTAEELGIKDVALGVYPYLERLYSATYRIVREDAAARPSLHNLEDIFAAETDLVYIDPWHVTMEANSRLAHEMTRIMEPAVQRHLRLADQ